MPDVRPYWHRSGTARVYRRRMSPTSQNPALEREIQAAFCVFDELVAAWVNLGSRKVGGEIDQLMYGELIEYAALRVETATSMAGLARNEKLADARGLGRSLL